jgi:putative inorganic carbon (HCO3(-)) transporter
MRPRVLEPVPPAAVAGRLAPVFVGFGLGLLAAAAASTRSVPMLAMVLLVTAGFALVIIGRLRRVLLGIALLDIPLQWDIYFGYRDDVDQMAGLAGFGVSLTTLALAGLYGMWAAALLADPDNAPRVRLRAVAAPLAFVAILLASLVVAGDRTVAGFQLTMYMQALLLLIYVAGTVRARDDLRFVVVLLLAGACLESVLALAMWAAGGALSLPGLETHTTAAVEGGGQRVGGTIGSPNNAGGYFAFMFALAAGVFMSGQRGSLRRLALAAGVLVFVCLVLTLSRGAWIACIVSTVVLAGGAGARKLSRAAVPGFVLAIVIVLVPLYSVISDRLLSSDHGAAEGRTPLIHMAWRMIEDHPTLGVGANNFVLVVPNYATGEYASAWLSTVHHKYLLIWAEAGPAALLAFLALVGGAIVRGWRARRADDPLVAGVGLGLSAAVAGHAVHMNFDLFAGGATTHMLWLAAGLLAAPVFSAKPP